ncbi:MAG: ATP-binding protein [Pseudonocardiaceae bacterium]|nr:ATP-binding protein [Pseudonocardiaceae bacterium]
MNARTAQVDDLRLVALPSAVNCTDLFVRFTLAEWSLQSMMDDTMHAARQLVMAAVGPGDSASPAILTVRLRVRGDCLSVEVEDDRPQQLAVVPSELSDRPSGVVSLERGGTLVWCELPLPSGMTAAEVRLPQRGPKKSSYSEQVSEEADMDPQVMQRILTALSQPRHGRAD